LTCLLPTLVVLAEFILTTETAHILLANLLDQSEQLMVESYTNGNAHKLTRVSAGKIQMYNHGK
jgi:hypothetical protein